MAIAPTKLTQSELLQVINSTPAGEVLTRSRLRRQMDAARLRIGDGRQHERRGSDRTSPLGRSSVLRPDVACG